MDRYIDRADESVRRRLYWGVSSQWREGDFGQEPEKWGKVCYLATKDLAGYRSCCELFIVACDRTLCREVANSPLKLLAGGSLSAGGWGRLSDLYNLQWFMVLTVFVVSWMFIIEWLILLCLSSCMQVCSDFNTRIMYWERERVEREREREDEWGDIWIEYMNMRNPQSSLTLANVLSSFGISGVKSFYQ